MPFTDSPALPRFLESELPFRRRGYVLEKSVDAGRRLHFIDQGDDSARPVVMLHGNPTWSFLWRKVIAKLPAHRCIAPDLLGLGFSDRLPSMTDHSIARHADAIAELVEALDLQDAIFVGQDWGGPILASVAARIPDRVAAMVLANTSVIIPAHLGGTAFHRLARRPVISHLVFRVLGYPLRSLHVVQGDPSSISGDVARAYQLPMRGWKNRGTVLALARMVPDTLMHPSIAELQRGEAWIRGFAGPISLVWGMRDPVLKRALPRHEEAFPNAVVYRTQAGHFLQEEVPEVLAEAIEALIV